MKKVAKEFLRKKYESMGYKVQRIRSSDNGYFVVFGQTEAGKGLGPQGLTSIRCNDPSEKAYPQLALPFASKTKRAKRGLM